MSYNLYATGGSFSVILLLISFNLRSPDFFISMWLFSIWWQRLTFRYSGYKLYIRSKFQDTWIIIIGIMKKS